MNRMENTRLVERIFEAPGISGRMSHGAKTYLLRLIPILTLSTIVLAPGRGLGTRAAWQSIQSAASAASALGAATRVSVSTEGDQGDSESSFPSISANGRYVAFISLASNLVGRDINGYDDIFVHDRQTGSTELVSVATDGSQGNNGSGYLGGPSISANGRIVAFGSYASNLVEGDTNGSMDIFVHDGQTGSTQRVSLASDGSQGNGSSWEPSISADGRFVAYYSSSSNLVSGDTNDSFDVFVYDRQTGSTQRVSVASDGSQQNGSSWHSAISPDGRYLAFTSNANNLVSEDTNGADDIFVHDSHTGSTERVSVASDGSQGNDGAGSSSISTDGRYVAFASGANNLVSGDTNSAGDVFVHDRQTGSTERVSLASDGSQGNDYSWYPSISPDGRSVGFNSFASNLVNEDTNNTQDVFLHDRQTGITVRVSVANDGSQGNDMSGYYEGIFLSADGHSVAFHSIASNLVSGDTNGVGDIFVHERSYAIYLPVTQYQP